MLTVFITNVNLVQKVARTDKRKLGKSHLNLKAVAMVRLLSYVGSVSKSYKTSFDGCCAIRIINSGRMMSGCSEFHHIVDADNMISS